MTTPVILTTAPQPMRRKRDRAQGPNDEKSNAKQLPLFALRSNIQFQNVWVNTTLFPRTNIKTTTARIIGYLETFFSIYRTWPSALS